MSSYLGQNFLTDNKIRLYIADKVKDFYTKNACEALVEIGPGKMSITKLIKDISNNFFVIEKDTVLVDEIIKQASYLNIKLENIINNDVIEVDVEKILSDHNILPEKTLVVGNLPYYITSPILRKFFGEKQKFAGGIFMVQHEVAEKIDHIANKKSFLRWLLNYDHTVSYCKKIPAKAFNPIPKVKSAIIEIKPKLESNDLNLEEVRKFLELFAPFSRKTIGKINKIVAKQTNKPYTIVENIEKKRLEELGWEEISEIIKKSSI